ncbi:acyl-CoA Delta-9 desaturase-like [Galleria mellonella]|uniref:Acyl-CoA Delta-9 desaturase-like n=1 Tax=Galleria mellonella TaxID=7137 RepID=A0A6J1WRH7_GALME|nr:acyl-CoA Delta-9 desaturase-like [Galleria mellonella]
MTAADSLRQEVEKSEEVCDIQRDMNKTEFTDIQNGKDTLSNINDIAKENEVDPKYLSTDYSYKHEIVWKNAIGFLILHLFAVWGAVLMFTGGVTWKTTLWTIFLGYVASEGVTIGAHRFYTHKSFKAKPLLKVILIIMQTLAGQNSIFIWCRDHRLHHRYSDTDADPHNSKRGFFFCHIGWLMMKKHPYVIELGKRIDMSDLQADWMVMFQKKYYYYLYVIFAIIIPVWVPVHYFGEPLFQSILTAYFTRYVSQLNGTWLVNSAAHLYGTRPYDKNLQPVESWFVSCISLGEGWHNYHHAFPWDYKAAELSMHFNQTASIIRFMEKIGLAYDLKTASPEMVRNRIIRTGDGTHYELGDEESRNAVKARGLLHPLNPSYTVTYKDPKATLKMEGLPLFNEKDVFDANVFIRNVGSR